MMRTKPIFRAFSHKLYKIMPELRRTYIPYKGFDRMFYIPGPWLSGYIFNIKISNKSKEKRLSKIYYQRYHRYNGSHKNLA